MEHDGTAPGLSAYFGRSSLYHSPNWERLETLEHGEVRRHGERGPDTRERAKRCDPTVEADVLRLLKQGVSYNQIGRQLNISPAVPRRIARKCGIDRSWAQGSAAGWQDARRRA